MLGPIRFWKLGWKLGTAIHVQRRRSQVVLGNDEDTELIGSSGSIRPS
jgi:hypothetical protein